MSQSEKRNPGLSKKLILAILVAGALPLVVGLSASYYRGNSELQNVIGSSFRTLAEVSASKVDEKLAQMITEARTMAQQAASDSTVRKRLLGHKHQHGDTAATRFDWRPAAEKKPAGEGILHASWVTDVAQPATRASDGAAIYLSGLSQDSASELYLLHISTPIYNAGKGEPIGWLQREYNIKALFDPLVYPIRFGETGHAMLIDHVGAIVSCPMLNTGDHISDASMVKRLIGGEAGWITANNDGHGEAAFSIIGHAPLSGANAFFHSGESLHMFVWQDSSEIFAPTRSLFAGVAIAGVLAIALLVALGFYASGQIVRPIQRLRQEASLIAAGDLSRPLAIETGDEIEELASEFEKMRVQLRQHIGALEDKLTGSERHFRAVMESAKDAIISGDESGNIMGWNAAAEKLFGYSESEIKDQPLTVLMPERFRDEHRDGLARVAAGGVAHVIGKTVELAGLHKDGSEFPLELSLAQWEASDGRFFTGIIRDITERKQKEEELRKSQAEKEQMMEQMIQNEKMAAVGTLASGIGHEINNPLYVIAGLAEAIHEEKDIEACHEYGADILKYGKEISAIVKNLSGYTRPANQDELEPIDVHERLENAVSMVKLALLDDCVEIQQKFASTPGIFAQPEEIGQVFFNIIRNGVQAMDGKGRMDLTTSLEENHVCIRIKDNGKGIKPEHLNKIFDPFFTTKGPDEGEGMGMFVVKNIIEKYNGTIELASEEGVGTEFTIKFPSAEPETAT
jgi:PAS domain S-box-containing protein